MKLKKNLLLSVGSLALGAAIVGGATFSDFSSSKEVANNTFTAGTLQMDLSPDANKTLNWVSPTNWAPGQEFSSTINFTNTGSVDAHHIYLGFKNITTGGGTNGANLLKKVIVTNLSEKFNGVDTGNEVANLAPQVGDHNNVLTLDELVNFMPGSYGYYTNDTGSDGVVLAGGDKKDYSLSLTFHFAEDADNNYQGTTAGFTIMANATQNSPTDGLASIHEPK
ncbi:TasA family protein [Neobacillus pocheonensis]|uniref:TasA family protein n=1 Tax=Neobacillus pocheonensis TaxID=363869 RepID=UPI003D2A58A9